MNPHVEKILKLPAHIRAIILAVIVVVEIVAFYFLMYEPKIDEYNRLNSQLKTFQGQVAQKREIANSLGRFKQEYARAQEQLQKALEKLPDKKEIPSLLTSISTLAKDQGMDILLFRPGGEVKKDFYAVVPVSLDMKGTYHETAMFFDSIGKLTRIVNVQNFSMRRESGSRVTGSDVNVKCSIETYRFLDQSEIQAKKKK